MAPFEKWGVKWLNIQRMSDSQLEFTDEAKNPRLSGVAGWAWLIRLELISKLKATCFVLTWYFGLEVLQGVWLLGTAVIERTVVLSKDSCGCFLEYESCIQFTTQRFLICLWCDATQSYNETENVLKCAF